MSDNLLYEGLTLMLVGMGTVFVFLTVLVAAMSAMSALAMRFLPDARPELVEGRILAAISAAVTEHRRRQ